MSVAIVLGIGCAFMVLERIKPGTRLPEARGFYLRALLLNALQVAAIVVAGLTWERWLRAGSLFSASSHLGALAAGALGYVVSTFVYYWWHRARHASAVLWRTCHQVHHSPARLEVVTAFYKHPVEQLANTLVSALVAYPLLGLSLEAAAVFTVLAGVAELIYHVNVATPRWLGWFIQRPEMHRIHHERGRHASNYGDLPLWDMLFGTYRNPAHFDGVCGFDDDAEQKLGAMLGFRDVHGSAGKPPRWRMWGLGAMALVGLSHPVGASLGLLGAPDSVSKAVSAPGKAMLASPAPKVFCRMGPLEPFAYRHRVEVERGGVTSSFALDRERYGSLPGPYALRNVYGAALVFGPLLPERTTEGVLRHGVCEPGGLLPGPRPDRVTIHSAPHEGALGPAFEQVVGCASGGGA